MKISIIAAMTPGTNIIGNNQGLPWKIPSDLKRFKQMTIGKPVIMGRKTYDSIGKPLPNRTNIVITRQSSLEEKLHGCIVVGSLEEALGAAKAQKADEVMIIGGQQIYNQSIRKADQLLITYVFAPIDGDTKFPSIASESEHHKWNFGTKWRLVECGEPLKGEKDEYYSVFCRYEK